MDKKTIIYHVKSVPFGMTIEEILEMYMATGILIYDKVKPYVIDVDNLDKDIVIIKYTEWLTLNGPPPIINSLLE